jgi:hypothetical protein
MVWSSRRQATSSFIVFQRAFFASLLQRVSKTGVKMEAVCPRCKTTSYRNPNMKLMVNVCGHNLCESCVELLFVKGCHWLSFLLNIHAE